MREDLLEDIRKRYKKLKYNTDTAPAILKKIEELEKNPIIRQYLDLQNELEDAMHSDSVSPKTNEEIVRTIFQELPDLDEMTGDTYGIYYCIGEYLHSEDFGVVLSAEGLTKKMVEKHVHVEYGQPLYKYEKREVSTYVAWNDERATHRVYTNIENSEDSRILPIEECTAWEAKHAIIFCSSPFDPTEYARLQTEFIITALNRGQDVAVRNMLDKTRGHRV